MFLRIRVSAKPAQAMSLNQPAGYPIRSTSLIASIGIHCIAILFLALVSPAPPALNRPILDELIQPEKHKITYYDFRKKPQDVEPIKKSDDSPQPRGAEPSKQIIIATAPKATSTQQMIWLPAPKIEIRQDIPSPNMIARMNTSLPSLPAPPKESRPAVEGVKAKAPNNSAVEPKGDPDHAPESTTPATAPPKQVRAFVPPPPSVRQPKLALPTLISDAPAPSISSPTMANRLPVGAGMPVLQTGAPPPPNAPLAPVANAGNANADIAVASLHPAENAKTSVPEGERPGRFSKAPDTGAPATGEVGKGAAVIVPNLTIREEKPKPAKLPDPNARAILYAERVRTIPFSTLSVPLRPSSRSIPRTVEARFQGRSVYTMVVPIENLPAYSGDWIVWFAERQPVPGEAPLMRAPLPFRKMESIEQRSLGGSGGERIQIAAILEKDGRLGKIAVSTKAGTETEQAVIQDLESWEFKPATRDGVPIDVDVVLEITFNLPVIAKRAQP